MDDKKYIGEKVSSSRRNSSRLNNIVDDWVEKRIRERKDIIFGKLVNFGYLFVMFGSILSSYIEFRKIEGYYNEMYMETRKTEQPGRK